MRKALLLVGVWLAASTAFSQIQIGDQSDYSIKERGYVGLGLGGLGFGSTSQGTYYSIGLTPQAGYMINQYVSTGIAFEYQYTGFSGQQRSYSMYGGYPYLRFNIKRFFAQADYDWYSVPASNSNDRKIFNRLPVGLGYFSQGNGRGGINFLASYDLLYSANSPFNSPLVIRVFLTL